MQVWHRKRSADDVVLKSLFRCAGIDLVKLIGPRVSRFSLSTARILQHYWIISCIREEVGSIDSSLRIASRPPPQPGRIVTRTVTVKSVLLIAFLPGIAIAFKTYLRYSAIRLIGGVPVRVIFLVRNHGGVLGELETGRPQMIVELIADHRTWQRIGWRTLIYSRGLDQSDAALVVCDVEYILL